MHEAMFYERLGGGRVRCTLCPHDCQIGEGRRGACGVRLNRSGRLLTLVYDKVIAANFAPVERRPLFHFMPGSLTYSIATVGCSMRCAYCQNWELSQWPRAAPPARVAGEVCLGSRALAKLERSIPGEPVDPQAIVSAALAAGAASIAYTLTEPTVFYELALDTAGLAREHGLRNIFMTNGFIREAPLRRMAPLLDAVNVGLKFYWDESYRRVSGAALKPVIEAMRLYRELGIWLEVTTILVPGLNDSDEEIGQMAGFIRSLGPEVPWHLSRFVPAYKLSDRECTTRETLERARAIGQAAGLRYVYACSLPGASHEDTACWRCGAIVMRRYGNRVVENRVFEGRCPRCDGVVDGVAMDGPAPLAYRRGRLQIN